MSEGAKVDKVTKVAKVLKALKVLRVLKVLKVVKVKQKKQRTMPEKLIRPVGNYRKLLSYQKTEVIYEMTFYFCQKYLQKGER